MKRNIVMIAILVLFGGGAWAYSHFVYSKYPATIRQLDRTIQLRDERLISAQIIHQQLDLVANLIEKNIALSKSDSLAEDASLPFMEFITTVLNNLEVKLEKMEPGRQSARLDYVRTPYTLTMKARYEQIGKFFNELEKSERLITIEQFEIDNAIRKSTALGEQGGDPAAKPIILRISTLTLIKHR